MLPPQYSVELWQQFSKSICLLAAWEDRPQETPFQILGVNNLVITPVHNVAI